MAVAHPTGQDAALYDSPDCRRSIAHFLAERGISVFPAHYGRPERHCTCPKNAACGRSGGKHPIHTGWQVESTTAQAQIRAWWAENLASTSAST